MRSVQGIIGRLTPGLLALLILGLGPLARLPALGPEQKEYAISIVVDVLKPKFQETVEGFKETMDRRLAASGARATYTIYDTKTDPATAAGILGGIRSSKPDLVCAINSPAAFADRNISLKLGEAFRVVSENCIPLQSGVARDWKRPGGNITGVGVFIKMNSLIRLAKMINPNYKKLIFFSWDRMTDINEWFVAELGRACREEGIELAEVKYLASAEEQFEYYLQCEKKGPEYFGVGGVSAWVHRDGSFADMTVEETSFIRANMSKFAIYSYDEAGVKLAIPAGACVVWKDIGAQLAEKGFQILSGESPATMAWEYPRTYNVMLNLAMARNFGITFPPALVSGAYRIYTDLEGNFIGK